jgi:hypothetical protein
LSIAGALDNPAQRRERCALERMKRPRRIRTFLFSICAVLILLTGAFWFFSGSDDLSRIHVEGKLSPKDVAAISSAIKRCIWREALPDLSWRSIRQFPAGVKHCFEFQRAAVQIYEREGNVTAVVEPRKKDHITTWWELMYRLERESSGWVARSEPRYDL